MIFILLPSHQLNQTNHINSTEAENGSNITVEYSTIDNNSTEIGTSMMTTVDTDNLGEIVFGEFQVISL